MKKFNLFKEITTAKTSEIKEAIESGKKFAINITGDICHEPFTYKDILIYFGIPDKEKNLEIAFGKNYQILVDDDRLLIKAFSNWQELISINTAQATYDDTTSDGVDEFATKDMEDIGWHATEFNIMYRDLVEVLENECEGTLLCIEQEEPYQFSGLGFLANYDDAKDTLFMYCKNKIKDMIDNDQDFKLSDLSDDEKDAAKFFKII
ncbi:MAG: hypothetical protein COB17_04195 [Sulfurimonas sp.]|nr:MAG: hypothetical protein COB17_04195 [Sulfurimonas sp.]